MKKHKKSGKKYTDYRGFRIVKDRTYTPYKEEEEIIFNVFHKQSKIFIGTSKSIKDFKQYIDTNNPQYGFVGWVLPEWPI